MRWDRTAVRAWIAAYEERNSDMQPVTRRLLALMNLRAQAQVPAHFLWEILGYETTMLSDGARRWWLILSTAKSRDVWDEFKTIAQNVGLRHAWKWLDGEIQPQQRQLIERRAGFLPQRAKAHMRKRGRPYYLWFKMGWWYRTSRWTRMLILGHSLDELRSYHQTWQRKLRPIIHCIERECAQRVRPDAMTPVAARWDVVRYVRQRMGGCLGRRVGMLSVSWFFCEPIPASDTDYWHYRLNRTQVRLQGAHSLIRRWR